MFNKLNSRLKNAIKSNNTQEKDFCRNIKAKISEYLVSLSLPRDKVSDEVFLKVVASYKKGLEKAVEMIGKHNELVEQYNQEINWCEDLLPKTLGEEEVKKLVLIAIDKVGKNTGKVMGEIMKNNKGLDGKLVKKIVNEALSA